MRYRSDSPSRPARTSMGTSPLQPKPGKCGAATATSAAATPVASTPKISLGTRAGTCSGSKCSAATAPTMAAATASQVSPSDDATVAAAALPPATAWLPSAIVSSRMACLPFCTCVRGGEPRVVGVGLVVRAVVAASEARPVARDQGPVHEGLGAHEGHERVEVCALVAVHGVDEPLQRRMPGRCVVEAHDLEQAPAGRHEGRVAVQGRRLLQAGVLLGLRAVAARLGVADVRVPGAVEAAGEPVENVALEQDHRLARVQEAPA